ncbi:MAG TPA: hypothetical protein VFY36_05425 [Solirubrobacteraceae bacterium]|nr:hypothetical protein [Solirubrobacteraceae bacterium]
MFKMRPEPSFNMQAPAEPRPEIPDHVLMIRYGVERLGYPEANFCEHIASRATIRGDAHATACVEQGTTVILVALWREMGTSWRVTLSSNNTKPYTIPELVKIIDGWSRTGVRPLARYR